MIRIHLFFYQLFFVSFMSSIVQFTFIVSISISPCIKINADAVGLHITQVFTEPGNCYFHGANCVVYEAFPFKCFFRPKLQIATLVCDADFFEMEIINTLNVTFYCFWWYVENYGKCGKWHFIINCVRLDFFFPSSILFLSYRKYLKGKKIYKLSTVSRVCITFSQVSQILTFLQ